MSPLDAISEVPRGAKAWLVIFHASSTRWVERVCPGRFKHVSLAGYVPDADAWIVLSWELARMRAGIVADRDIEAWLPVWAGDGGAVLRFKAPDFDLGPWRPRLGLFCVPMVCHVLGLRRGALRPMALWRLLLANGAEIASESAEDPGAQTDGAGESAGRRCPEGSIRRSPAVG